MNSMLWRNIMVMFGCIFAGFAYHEALAHSRFWTLAYCLDAGMFFCSALIWHGRVNDNRNPGDLR